MEFQVRAALGSDSNTPENEDRLIELCTEEKIESGFDRLIGSLVRHDRPSMIIVPKKYQEIN